MTFRDFRGKGGAAERELSLTDCQLQSSGILYAVQGYRILRPQPRSADAALGGRSYVISGTLDQPHVQTVTNPAAEAALR